MFYSRSSLFLCATFICLLGLFPNYVLAKSEPSPIEKAIERMSLEQKVGQLFMVGFPQTEVDEKLLSFINKAKPGAFLLFKRNIKSLNQVQKLNEELSRLTLKSSGLRPLIAVDQEGGVVSRIPIQPPMPNALALGLTESREIAEQYGEAVGSLLLRLGFNMNLAPVLDLSDPSQPSFIGVRSLGGNPEKVGDMGEAMSRGFHRSKIIATAKHFPGLGSSTHDPHSTLVTRITSLEDFYSTDLKPFQKFSKIGPESAIMLSHLSYPVLDPSNVPAVFSEKIVKNLLREKLGFSGLVITDDLMMQGASQHAKPEDAAVLALKSGADIIMVTWSFRSQLKAIERVKQAIKTGELPVGEVDKKLIRIFQAKMLSYPTKQNQQQFRSIASKKNDSLREVENFILDTNIKSQAHKISLVESRRTCVVSSRQSFLSSYKKGSAEKAYYFQLPEKATQAHVENIFKKNLCDSLVFTVFGKRTADLISGLPLEIKEKVLLVNLGAPMTPADTESFASVVNLYFAHLNAGQKIAQHISGNKKNYARATSK